MLAAHFVHQLKHQFLLSLKWANLLHKPCLPTSSFRQAILTSLSYDLLEVWRLQPSLGNVSK